VKLETLRGYPPAFFVEIYASAVVSKAVENSLFEVTGQQSVSLYRSLVLVQLLVDGC
jgi:hypothetical protein